jgi:hypothetical protein
VHKGGNLTIQWTVCLHPPYSTDLASPICHLFGPLKKALQGCHFADNDELKHSVREELRCFSKELYMNGIMAYRITSTGGKKCGGNEEDFVEI